MHFTSDAYVMPWSKAVEAVYECLSKSGVEFNDFFYFFFMKRFGGHLKTNAG